MEMLITGTPISAHNALLHGLISRVVPEERLEEETLAIARRVCQASRSVVALGKATFQRSEVTRCSSKGGLNTTSYFHLTISKSTFLTNFFQTNGIILV